MVEEKRTLCSNPVMGSERSTDDALLGWLDRGLQHSVEPCYKNALSWVSAASEPKQCVVVLGKKARDTIAGLVLLLNKLPTFSATPLSEANKRAEQEQLTTAFQHALVQLESVYEAILRPTEVPVLQKEGDETASSAAQYVSRR